MELRQYIRILIARWWLIALVTMVGTGSGAYYTLRQPPVYHSTVTLLLDPAASPTTLVASSLAEQDLKLIATYSRYLQTQAFAEMVIEREGLDISAAQLIDAISTRWLEGTLFFQITATSSEAERAQVLAAAIADNFIEANHQAQIAARRQVRELGSIQPVLQEKLERERQYYEELVENLRTEVAQIQQQPPSTARNELMAGVQTQLSAYEERLLQIMRDQIALQQDQELNQINTVSVIEPASLPASPQSTGKIQDILLALTASLAVAVTLAAGLEYLDNTVKGPQEVEMLVGEPPLAMLHNIAGKPHQDGPIALTEPHALVTEAFRALHTNILFSQPAARLRSLVITSGGPGEGKSTVAANLAVVMADTGLRVLLVDADMRWPTLHKHFGLVNNVGLSSLIIHSRATDPEVLRRHLQQGPVETLRILTCGSVPPNAAALLSSERTRLVLEALEAEADVVLYDTPPAMLVTDAVILASRADVTLQIVHTGVTRRQVMLKTRETLQRVNANLLAPVLNRVSAANAGYYKYPYYGVAYSASDERQPMYPRAAAPGALAHRNGER